MQTITKEKAKKLIDKGAIVVDMRSPVSFRDGHIDGAVNLPLKKFTNLLMATPDRKKAFILYGVTTEDEDVVHGFKYSEQLGFTNVHVTDYTTIR
jgi:3-mercaptopyruvate sulfurtransferase SseA